MTLDVRTRCAVCAWRESCVKKHTVKEQALHCPDFCRDRSLPEEPGEEAAVERHKNIDDVFGEG
ncbi:MAG: hypothetical protein Kow0092_25420 [Deferrisomatales bacterium]